MKLRMVFENEVFSSSDLFLFNGVNSSILHGQEMSYLGARACAHACMFACLRDKKHSRVNKGMCFP